MFFIIKKPKVSSHIDQQAKEKIQRLKELKLINLSENQLKYFYFFHYFIEKLNKNNILKQNYRLNMIINFALKFQT